VTGGLGLQGSRLTERLLRAGFSVNIIDNKQRGTTRNLSEYCVALFDKKLDLHLVDARDRSHVYACIQGSETVFHLSAHLGGVEYIHVMQPDQMPTWDNMMMDGSVISASLEAKVKRFIFASTACVYPVSKQLRWDSELVESDALNPVEPESGYGWVKLATEIGLRKISSMNIGILRLFNVYGEGEDYSHGSHVIPELCRKVAIWPKEEVVVFGNGEQGRCFLYVDDAVEAYMLCMEKGCINQPINIGSPDPIKIKELIKILKRISGKDFSPRFDMDKPSGVMGRVPNIEKAKNFLGWSPKTPLIQGLPRVYQWIEGQVAGKK